MLNVDIDIESLLALRTGHKFWLTGEPYTFLCFYCSETFVQLWIIRHGKLDIGATKFVTTNVKTKTFNDAFHARFDRLP